LILIRRAATLALLTALALPGCSPAPVPNGAAPGSIDIAQDPLQRDLGGVKGIAIERGGYQFFVSPKADYILRGIVVGREGYGSGWNALLSPCDLAVVWGKLAENGLYRKLSWSQSGRWYYWEYPGDFGYDNAFIGRYSSNSHIIPASENLRGAALAIREGDTVEIAGQLVDVDGRKGEGTVWWYSSLSRDDNGDGSCEVIYVTRIVRRGKVYE
jgi:hypothetical protein